jgi:hypothetical protein
MSKSGTYRWDAQQGKMIKISDRIPNVSSLDNVAAVPNGGYYSEQLGTFIESKQQKKRVMERQGVRQVEPGEKMTGARVKTAAEKKAERRKVIEQCLPM